MNKHEILGTVLLVIGALLAVSEMHTLTIYLLAVALACFVGGAVAFVGGSLTSTLAAIAVVLLLGLPIAHWLRARMKNAASESMSQDDVGRDVLVIESGNGRLRVNYRGTAWDARLSKADATLPRPGQNLRIVARDGNTLVLEAVAAA